MNNIGIAGIDDDGTLCETCGNEIRAGECMFFNVNLEEDGVFVIYGNNDPRIPTDEHFLNADPAPAPVCGSCMGIKAKTV